MGEIFQREGITYNNYEVSSQVLKGKRITSQPQDEGAGQIDRMAMMKRGIAVLEMRASNANLDEVFGILTPTVLRPTEEKATAPRGGKSIALTEGSSSMSDALTQQGVAQPKLSTQSAELYQK
jgi:hypothetical protein